MRTCSRSCSPTSASPVMTRTMPGFFSVKASSISVSFSTCLRPSASSCVMRLASVKTEVSMNSIRPSYICALEAKWRYSAASETPRLSASAAVVIFSHFGASSICASAFRISSFRSPLARGMGGEWILSRASAENQARQLDHRCDAQIDVRHAAPLARHPHRRHAEAVRGTQVLGRIVDECAPMRIQVMLAQQVIEPVQRRLAAVARIFDAVDGVEIPLQADHPQHLLDIVPRRVGEDELAAAEELERVLERVLVHHHV